ncbi:MAG: TolC family protein [Candidatus Omnitrophica bacterium]|nr:TolC family protein [Candidatus Omnitrophota bacterium]
MLKKLIVLLIIIVGIVEPVFAAKEIIAQSSSLEKVSLSSLIQEALENNPRLQAAQYRLEAAKARVEIFRSVPDPMVEYEYDRIGPAASMAGGGKVRPMKTLAISQEIPFPTKIIMRKQASQKQANALEQDYEETRRTIIKEVKDAYAKLFLNRRKVDYINDTLNLMGQFVEIATKKYAVNKIGQQDVLRAQVEYSKLSNMAVLYEQEAKIAESLLLSLLGREDYATITLLPIDSIKDLVLSPEDVSILAKNDRAELKSMRELVDKAEIESSLSQQDFLPDVTLKYKRSQQNGSFQDGEWSGMVGINIPFWFWGKQLSGVKEAKANLQVAKADYQSAENLVVFEARSAFAKYEAARHLVEIYETGVLPQATSAVTTARRAYESGSVSFLELLDSLRMLRDLQIEYFESVASLQVALADLERSVGGSLQEQEKL